MKQASPVHFVAGFFEVIAPDVQRRGDKPSAAAYSHVPSRSRSSLRHACPRTPEEQSDHRPCAHRSDRWRSCTRLQLSLLALFFGRFPGVNSAEVLHAYAALLCSAGGAPTASSLSSKDRVSGSSAPRPARFDTRPQHGSTRTGCRPLPRNDEVPPEIIHSSREPEMQREQNIRRMCRTRTVTMARE